MPSKNVVSAVAVAEESSFASDPTEDAVSDISDATSAADLARFVEVEIKGKTVKVEYDMGEISLRLRKRFIAMSDGDELIVSILTAIVSSWNLTDRQGNPVDLVDVDDVGSGTLTKIMEAINADLVPNE